MHHITFTQPDDWHLHLRDGVNMASVVAATARCFARAIIMPNLKSPITTVNQAIASKVKESEFHLSVLPYNNIIINTALKYKCFFMKR